MVEDLEKARQIISRANIEIMNGANAIRNIVSEAKLDEKVSFDIENELQGIEFEVLELDHKLDL